MTTQSNKCNYHEASDAVDICCKCHARMCINCKRYIEEEKILYPYCLVCCKKIDREEEDREKLRQIRRPYVWLLGINALLMMALYVVGLLSALAHWNSYWFICLLIITMVYSVWLMLAYYKKWLGPTALTPAHD